VAIRNVRRHTNDELRKAEKDGDIAQDDLKRSEEELQKITDRHIATVEAEARKKEADLLEV
jgi:ribosome recycling factor